MKITETIESGYKGFYEFLIKGLKTANFNYQAQKMGFNNIKNNEVQFTFLKVIYTINNNGIHPQKEYKFNIIPLLCVFTYYFLNKNTVGKPDCNFRTLNQLKGPLDTSKNLNNNLLNKKMQDCFKNNFISLNSVCQNLGANFLNKNAAGAYVWQFNDLNKLPFQVIFFEADEEFNEEYEILFPENSLHFMEFESLAYLSGSVINIICNEIIK